MAQEDISSTGKVQQIFDDFLRYRHQNKINKALEVLSEAAKIAENNEDAKLLLDTYHQYARLFLEEGDRETAIFYLDRASILLRDLSYPFGEAFHKYLEAAVRFDEGNNFQSLKLLEEARTLSNNRNLGNNILLLEGYIFTNIEKFDDANTNLNALIVNSDDKERPYLATKANVQLALISQENKDLEDAVIHAKAALELSQKHGYFKEIRVSNELLSSIYESLGLYDQSLFYKKSLGQIKDSIFNIEKGG
ncbi:MAG: tetratricopeptide repeat protein, partial [Bacteroidota bacterium]